MFHKKQIKAFTLLECLVALLVIAGTVQVYQGLSKILAAEVIYFSTNQNEEWLLFSQQLSDELSGTRLMRIERGKLYVIKGKKELAFGLAKSGDFRKTSADGRGYQPMLFGVEDCQISQDGDVVKLNLVLSNGLERSFIYAFEKTS